MRELRIIDDENYEQYLSDFIKQNDSVLIHIENSHELNNDFKLLSLIEKTAIFLYFEKNYRTSEIAKILKIKEQSAYVQIALDCMKHKNNTNLSLTELSMDMKSAFRLYNRELAVITADAKVYAERKLAEKKRINFNLHNKNY